METAISLSSNSYKDLWNVEHPDRRWELSYGTKDKMYLTDLEKDKLVDQMKKGSSVIEISGNFFSTKFLYLVAIKSKRVNKSPKPVYKNGQIVSYEL